MKVAILEHFRPPYQNCGSEIFMQRLARRLRDAGHDVAIVTTDTPQAPDVCLYDEMRCYSIDASTSAIDSTLRRLGPDLLITHHQRAMVGVPLARFIGCPSIFVMHNDFAHNQRVLMNGPSLVIYNTEWIAEKFKIRTPRYLVVHPPVLPDECDQPPGDAVTLINLNRDKGSEVFYAVAERLPQHPFLGVVGAHGNQYIRTDLPNVTIQEHTDRMCWNVWARTKVLMMPSIYESYGMTAIEACYQGIPVLANPTSGLLESLGTGGWFIDRPDIEGYAQAVDKLLTDQPFWRERSAAARARGAEINAAAELDEFCRQAELLVSERSRV